MIENFKQYIVKSKPYLIITASFTASLILILIIIDSWILPAVIHSGDQIPMPNLVNKNIDDVKIILNDANLDIEKISEQYSENYPKGHVLSQIPKPGKIVKEGRNIYLIVSKGMETVKVPFLIGQSLFTARRTLQAAGLTIGDIQYAFSDGYGADTIIVQNVQANSDVIYGASIGVVISRGSEFQISVPNLIGLSYSEALSSIIESKLILGITDSIPSDTYLPNTVIRQTPYSGELVGKNTLINIVVTK